MKAKQLFEQTRKPLAEGDAEGQMQRGPNPPPGTTSTRRPPPRQLEPDNPENMAQRPGGPRMFSGPGGPHMLRRPGMGAPEPMQGPFSASDMSKLKDVLLLIVCNLSRNSFDEEIARAMMSGQPPNPGHIRHILDEVGRIKDIPEGHHAVLQKAYAWLQKQQSP
jgi:hypothetical protein